MLAILRTLTSLAPGSTSMERGPLCFEEKRRQVDAILNNGADQQSEQELIARIDRIESGVDRIEKQYYIANVSNARQSSAPRPAPSSRSSSSAEAVPTATLEQAITLILRCGS